MSEQTVYLGNPNLKRANVDQEWTKEEIEEYYLLGPIELELDIYPMIVTYHSPFGQAIVGKKIDEDFILEIKGKETKFTITAIEKISAE